MICRRFAMFSIVVVFVAAGWCLLGSSVLTTAKAARADAGTTLVATRAVAGGGEITIRSSSITAGGVVSSGGNFQATSSVGVPISGQAEGGEFTASGGFLPSAVAEPPCPADLNDNGVVNAQDLALLLGAWGPNPGHPADINGDGVVNAADLAQLLGNWGPCP